MRRRLLFPLFFLLLLAAIGSWSACTTTSETGTSGGIFGDRPIDPGEEEQDSGAKKDGASDADAKDVATDRGTDTSTAADAEENDT